MSRLDQEQDVIDLADELGLEGNPVDAIIGFCQQKIVRWNNEAGPVETIAKLETVVAANLNLVFEEFFSDEELSDAIRKYTSDGEAAFAALGFLFDDGTFGTMMERRNVAHDAPDRFVAFIDCRGDKAARRFFTRWHEIAHLLVLEKELTEPVHRSTDAPLERLMDEIAGHVGFFDQLFQPLLAKLHTDTHLSFEVIEAIREAFCPEASFQSTMFACHRRVATPLVYLEAAMGFKKDEERQLNSKQQSLFEVEQPVAKLRILTVVPNGKAKKEKMYVTKKMRVPASSIVQQAYLGDSEQGVSGYENLSSWEHSSGTCLADVDVYIEARRVADRVIAIIQKHEAVN